MESLLKNFLQHLEWFEHDALSAADLQAATLDLQRAVNDLRISDPRLFRERVRVSQELETQALTLALDLAPRTKAIERIRRLCDLDVRQLADAANAGLRSRRRSQTTDHLDKTIHNQWRIGEIAGRGASAVYHVTHTLSQRKACLKIIPFDEDYIDQRARFETEVQIPAIVGAKALVPILDAFESPTLDAFCIVMEYIDGIHIDTWAQRKGFISALDAMLSMLPSLEQCHSKGYVHRDLKPSNIIVAEGANDTHTTWLLDFGIAGVKGKNHNTRSSQVLGTVGYMSPEQIRRPKDLDRASDIWSLGVILYELVTAMLPFPQESIVDMHEAMKTGYYVSASDRVSGPMSDVIERCLHLMPSERFNSVEQLADAIKAARQPTRPPTPPSIAAREKTGTHESMVPAQRGVLIPDHARPSGSHLVEPCDVCGSMDRDATRCLGCGRVL